MKCTLEKVLDLSLKFTSLSIGKNYNRTLLIYSVKSYLLEQVMVKKDKGRDGNKPKGKF